MPRQSKRVLDLSAAEVPTKTKAALKPLTEKQFAEYQRQVAAVHRWLTKLKRASNALAKAQKNVARFERQLRAFPVK